MAALLFLLTFAKGMAWVSLVPIGQHPDEPAHASYADSIAFSDSFGQEPRIYTKAVDESLKAAGFGRMYSDPQLKGPFDERFLKDRDERLDEAIRQRDELSTNTAGAGTYPPLYYFLSGLVIQATEDDRYDTTWLLQRSLSVLMAAVTIVIQFSILLALFARSVAKAGLAALALTMMPMYTAMESAINPEVLIVLLGSILLVISLRLLHDPYRWALHLGAGLTMGIGFITKPNIVAFALPFVLAAVYGAVSTRGEQRWRRVFVRSLLRAGAFLVPLVLVYGAWRAIPTPEGAPTAAAGITSFEVSREALTGLVERLRTEGRWRFSDLYWGVFGWVQAPMPPLALFAAFWGSVAGFVALLVTAIQRSIPARIWVAGSAIAAVMAMIIYIEYLAVLGGAGGFAQGRYLFPVAVAIVGIHMWALDQLLRPRWRIRTAFWACAPAVAIGFHVIAPLQTVIPRYFL